MWSEPFLWVALAVGSVTGGLCAYLGNFVLMKNMTFISIALAEIAALGVALGLALHWDAHLTAFAVTLIAVVFFWKRNLKGRAPHEGLTGTLYVVSAALGMLIIAKNPLLESHGLDLVSGNLLYCTFHDLVTEVVLGLVLILIHGLCRKEFLFVAFDLETARAHGLKAAAWDLLLMVTIGVWIAMCMSHAGVLFVFASLVIPGVTALAVCRRVNSVFLVSVGVTLLSVFCGISASYRFDLPTSPAIICGYGVCFLAALAFKSLAKHGQLRRRAT